MVHNYFGNLNIGHWYDCAGKFEGNALQCKMDQLLEAFCSIHHHSAFVHCYTFVSCNSSWTAIGVFGTGIIEYLNNNCWAPVKLMYASEQLAYIVPCMAVDYVLLWMSSSSVSSLYFHTSKKRMYIANRKQPFQTSVESTKLCTEKQGYIHWITVPFYSIMTWPRTIWRNFHDRGSGGCQDFLQAVSFACKPFWIPNFSKWICHCPLRTKVLSIFKCFRTCCYKYIICEAWHESKVYTYPGILIPNMLKKIGIGLSVLVAQEIICKALIYSSSGRWWFCMQGSHQWFKVVSLEWYSLKHHQKWNSMLQAYICC